MSGMNHEDNVEHVLSLMPENVLEIFIDPAPMNT
jgi:hypothetical protein